MKVSQKFCGDSVSPKSQSPFPHSLNEGCLETCTDLGHERKWRHTGSKPRLGASRSPRSPPVCRGSGEPAGGQVMEMYVWFIHSPINGHFQLLLLVPNAATNMRVQISPNPCLLVF